MTVKMSVLRPGVQTTVQDVHGRTGLWDVGVPPSGAFDEFSMALAQEAVGNPPTAAGLECVVHGPSVSFDRRVLICLTGAAHSATVDGRPIRPGQVGVVAAGEVLDVGPIDGLGMRAYLAVAGGLDVPLVLGSRATFILANFGGFEGRPIRAGDIIDVGDQQNLLAPLDLAELLPELTDVWTLRVIPGPHGAPEYLTAAGVDELLGADWVVDHRADRTGVRLVGPVPQWSRDDGGEAGIHPSNLHDSAYPVGGIMLSGDTPVIVGKDGPSLGGFVVPAVVIAADLWKLGQLRPGDHVNLSAVAPEVADAAWAERQTLLSELPGAVDRQFHLDRGRIQMAPVQHSGTRPDRPEILCQSGPVGSSPGFTVRRSGDRYLLVQAGPLELDLTVRVWIHLLAEAVRDARIDGVSEIVEGVRSVLICIGDSRLTLPILATRLAELATSLDDPSTVVLDVREVELPIAFDHPEVHEAMRRYDSVRPDAPWSPDNVEFIRRVNDLEGRDEVFDIVTAATYLVVGLGDVYLGAPVAVPIDPRHRLVTTKYNPARMWTPQNAVGIGGIYLCVYGMEGPGGYQLVGRTVPVWRLSPRDEKPWLLRQFDRLRFTPVSVEELHGLRADVKSGRTDLAMRPATFSIEEVTDLTRQHGEEIGRLRAKRRAAFDTERMRWSA
ncbi:MAG: Urea carboxylase [Pseudonocardiales bacterium]|nr:Urea carboxylase [Pseudonocardiales bacterium]